MTNMIDLGFSLLIVFMITAPLLEQEQSIAVNLPVESAKPQASEKDLRFQVVAIDGRGNFYYGDRQVSFTELAERLRSIATQSDPPVISLRADLTLQYQQVIRVLDEVKKNNLTKIHLDTQIQGS